MHDYAGFGLRLAASLIDTVFFLIIFVLIQLIFSIMGLRMPVFGGWFEQPLILLVTAFMWIKFMGTPGKLLMGCHVVDAETRQPLTLVQALVRYLGYFVSLIPLGLGFFWILWDKRRQGFHDKIAKTIVVLDVRPQGADESQKTLEQLMKEAK